MEKKRLLEICKSYEDDALKRTTRKYSIITTKASTAIIKELCKIDGLTPIMAESALRKAAEILENAIKSEIIS